MKWAQIIIYIHFLVLGLSGCQTSEKVEAFTCNHLTPLQSGIPGSPDNLIRLENRPAPVTELAALMRDMLNEMKDRRQQLLNNQPVSPLKSYEKIKCAWPTEMSTRSAKFDEFANLNLSFIDTFNQKPSKSAYNAVVASCITCHQTTCPGPMAAIRPLVLDTGESLKPLEENQEGACEAPAETNP